MQHVKNRWADTQLAQPEAAHAASELDDDVWEAMGLLETVVFWGLLLGVPALVVVVGLLVSVL